jgi:LysM repeat protein
VYDHEIIYSGSVDETIISWNMREKSVIHVFEGHEGSITALATCQGMLASAAADVTTRLWDTATGNQLRVLYGHMKSVLSLELGHDWLITGSADEEARVWKINHISPKKISARTTHRLSGHEQAVTCVRYGRLEVLTGDNVGVIFIWWMATGNVIRRIEAHRGMVKSMQFDSVHVVSGGVDHNVCISDLATGEVMQTLRVHEGHVLLIGFDSEYIISMSADNTIRVYKWGKEASLQDKYHVLGVGESLMHVSKTTGVLVSDIMKWNDIKDTRQLHAGMKLIVAKGNPDELTKAEKLAADRERRMAGRSLPTAEGQELVSAADRALLHPTKLHSMLADGNDDSYSLANRLFGQVKSDTEIFPTCIDYDAGTYSLASRLQNKAAKLNGNKHFRPRYHISIDNEEEWGSVCASLLQAMIEVYAERESISVCKEAVRPTSATSTLASRMRRKIESSTIVPQITTASTAGVMGDIIEEDEEGEEGDDVQ